MVCKECGKEHWLMQLEEDGTHLCLACAVERPFVGAVMFEDGTKFPGTFQVIPHEDIGLVIPFHSKPSDAPIDGDE